MEITLDFPKAKKETEYISRRIYQGDLEKLNFILQVKKTTFKDLFHTVIESIHSEITK